jgi:hypothetical protein
VEVVAIGVVGVLPIALVLLFLVKTIRRMQTRPVELPPWQSQMEEPPGGDPSGDREPRRPLLPARSGAVAMSEPSEEESDLTRIELEATQLVPDAQRRRLAG